MNKKFVTTKDSNYFSCVEIDMDSCVKVSEIRWTKSNEIRHDKQMSRERGFAEMNYCPVFFCLYFLFIRNLPESHDKWRKIGYNKD